MDDSSDTTRLPPDGRQHIEAARLAGIHRKTLEYLLKTWISTGRPRLIFCLALLKNCG